MREYPSDNVYLNPAITQSLLIDLPAQAWPINQYLLPPLVLNGEEIIIDIPPLPPIPEPPPIPTPDVPPVVPVPIFIVPDPQGKNDPNSAGGENGWVVDAGDPNPALVPIVILPDVPPNNDTPEDVAPEWEPTTVTPVWPTPDPSNPNQGSPAPSPVPPQVIDWGGGGGGDTPEPAPEPDPVIDKEKCEQGGEILEVSDLLGSAFYDEVIDTLRLDCCGGRGYSVDIPYEGVYLYLSEHPELYTEDILWYYPCNYLPVALNSNFLYDCQSCDPNVDMYEPGWRPWSPPPLPCSALRSLIIQRPRLDDPRYSCYYNVAFIGYYATKPLAPACHPFFGYKRDEGP